MLIKVKRRKLEILINASFMSYLFFINKILQVSSAQFYDTSSVHCTVCSPLHVKSSSITVYPPSTLLQLPSNPAITTLLSRSLSSLSFVFFALSHYSPYPNSYQPAIYESLSIFLISSFSSLDSTLE